MPTVRQLSRVDARRLAIRGQLLTADRPTDVGPALSHLTSIQFDQVSHVAPSADLVLWSRIGSSYSPADLQDAIDEQRVIDLQTLLRPAEDLALFRAEMAEWPGTGDLKDWQQFRRDWVEDNNSFREELLELLLQDGPLTADDLPNDCPRPWRSSGWNENRNRAIMLEFLVSRGEIAIAGGVGRHRLWDLASRVYPDLPAVPAADAIRLRNERRLQALGIARAKAPQCPTEPSDVGAAGEPAVVDGVRGQWRIEASLLDQPFEPRTALLSPLDRLVYDRKRMTELFEFDYQLEMFKPATNRRWGYWAMPILSGDRLVGKLDAQTDRSARVLRVNAIHEDVPFTKAMTAAVKHEIRDLAEWLGVGLDLPS